MYPEILQLMKITMTIPLSTAWPERGFSALKRIKSLMRNRLLTAMLNALLQISLNGPRILTDQQAKRIAEKWHSEKQRRKVTPRGMKDVLEYGKKIEEDRIKMMTRTIEDDENESDDFEEQFPQHYSVSAFDDVQFYDDAAT